MPAMAPEPTVCIIDQATYAVVDGSGTSITKSSGVWVALA